MPALGDLKQIITLAADEYKKDNSASLGPLHGKEETEQEHIDAWLQKIDGINDIASLHNEIIGYLKDDKKGNSNSSSFRTYLLDRLLGGHNSKPELEDTTARFFEKFDILQSQFQGKASTHADDIELALLKQNHLAQIDYNVARIISSFLEDKDRTKMGSLSFSLHGIFQPHTLLYKIIEHLRGDKYQKAAEILKKHPKLLHETVNFTEGTGPSKKEIEVSPFQLLANQVLEHVVNGRQDEAEFILKDHPEVMFEKGYVKDPGGRTFDSISPFEYAIWSRDRHMWNMLIKQVQLQPDAERFALMKKEANEQYKCIADADYHHDFPLLNALSIYVEACKNSTDDELDKLWLEVGKAQSETVAHVRDEYLRPDRSFEPIPGSPPDFKEAKLPRNSDFYNYVTHRAEKWWPLDSRLGIDFAICRYNKRGRARGHPRGDGRGGLGCDLPAVTALCKVRTEEFKLLGEQLLNLHQKPEVVNSPRPGV